MIFIPARLRSLTMGVALAILALVSISHAGGSAELEVAISSVSKKFMVAGGDVIISPTISISYQDPLSTPVSAGFNLIHTYDGNFVEFLSAEAGVDLQSLNGGSGPDFFGVESSTGGVAIGVVYDLMGTQHLQYDLPQEVIQLHYRVSATALAANPNGFSTTLQMVNSLAGLFGQTYVLIDDGPSIPDSYVDGILEFSPRLFRRGDLNADNSLDLGDVVTLLGHLFNSFPLVCHVAADVNNDHGLDIADPIALLSYLFAGGTLAAPFLTCGVDELSPLDCESFLTCP